MTSPPPFVPGSPAPSPLEPAPALDGRGARAQVLLYQPADPIGGIFICSRCGAAAFQPDLLDHRADCAYAGGRSDAAGS